MEAEQLNPVDFRSGQRQQWNQAASGWRRWSELIDSAASGVSQRMVELAGVESGSRVLDVAAGYGEPSLSAARAAGPDGAVVATDISTEMIAFGRERAEAAGLGNVEFVESEAAALDFPEGSFDAALSRFGIIFEPEAEDVAARVRGFLRPAGRMVIASWGPPERVPFIAIPMQTAMRALDVPPPPPGTPGPLSRPTAETLGGLLGAGGFSDVDVEETEVEFEWESPEDFTRFVQEIAPPIRAIIDPHPTDARDETWRAITEAIRERAADDGAVRLQNLALMAVGRA
jgi:SAM-dependent methyltransferase